MAKNLDVILQVRDGYSKATKDFNRQLKLSKAELKNTQAQLKANEKDTDALAKKQELLANKTQLVNNQIKETEKILRAENNELQTKQKSMSAIEKDVNRLNKAYQENVKNLGEEHKQTKASLKELNSKYKELKKANKEYDEAANNVQKYSLQLVKLNGELQDSSREFAKTELSIKGLDKTMDDSTKSADKLDKKLDKLGKKDLSNIGDKMMGLGVGLGTATVAMGSLGASENMQHEYGMAKISSIVDVSQQEIEALGDSIIETSNKFGVAGADIRESVYQALSSSVRFEDVSQVLEHSLKLSKGGFADLTSTLDVLTNIMNSYGMGASDLQAISDQLFQTTVVGKTTIEELSTQFSGLSVIAANTGVSLEQALSGLALITQSGTSTSEAVTQMRALLDELGNSTTVVGKLIKSELGMSFQDAMKEGIELDDVLVHLDKSAKANNSSLMEMLGSIEAGQAALQILSKEGKRFDDTLQLITNSAGSTQEAFEKVDATQFAKMEKSVQNLKNSMLAVGEAVSPYVDDVANGLETIADTISKTDEGTIKLLASISALTIGVGGVIKVATKLKGVLAIIKPLISGAGLSLGGIGVAGAAIAGIIGVFDMLNTSTEEQTKKVEVQQNKLNELKGSYEALSGIDSSQRTSQQEVILKGLEKEIELNEKLLAQENEKLIKNELYGKGKIGWGTLGDAMGRQSDIEYVQNTIKQLEQAIDNATSDIEKDSLIVKLGQETQKSSEYIEEFNGYLADLEEGYELATDKEKAYIDELKEFQKTLNSTDFIGAQKDQENLAASIDEVNRSTKDGIQTQKNYIAEFEDYKSKLSGYTAILEELDSKHALSADTVSTIANEYPQLLSALDDETELRKTLTGLIAEQEQGIQTSYVNMLSASSDYYNAELMQSEDFYNAKILGDEQLYNTLTEGIEGYFDNLGEAYQVDLKNYTDLESSKMETTKDLIRKLAGAWSDYFSVTMDGVKFDKTQFLKENPYATEADLLEMNRVYSEAAKYQRKFQELANGMTITPIKLDTINLDKGNKSSSKTSTSKNTQYIKSLYQSLVDDVLRGGQDVEKAIEMTNLKIENAALLGDKKLELEHSNHLTDLFKQERDKQAEMAKQLDKYISDMKQDLSKTGLFNKIDLSNLSDLQLDTVINNLDRQLASANDKEKQRLEGLKSVISDVGRVYVSTIEKREDLSRAWWEKENQRKQQEIDNINRVHNLQKQNLDHEMKLLDVEKMFIDENDLDQVSNMVDREMDIIVRNMKLAEDRIVALRKQGVEETADTIKQEKNLWIDLHTQRLQLEKQIAEQRRQNAIKDNQDVISDLNDIQNAPKELLDMVMQMLRQETEDKKEELEEQLENKKEALDEEYEAEKEAINKRLELIRKEADERKNALRKEQDERDYNRGLEEKQQKIKDVEDKILALSNDDSIQAIKKRKELEAELKKYKQELEDYQYDREVSLREEAIDNELKSQEEKLEKELENLEEQHEQELDMLDKKHKQEIKKYQDMLSSQKALRDKALALIEKGDKELLDRLIKYNENYGDGMRESVIASWDQAYDAMNRFSGGSNNVLETIVAMREEMERLVEESERLADQSWTDFADEEDIRPSNPDKNNGSDSSDDKYGGLTDYDDKVAYRDKQLKKMIALGDEMNRTPSADKEKIKKLKQEQEEIAKTIGAYNQGGTWYIMIKGKKYKVRDAVGIYHEGGIVGKNDISVDPKTEEFAKLMKGEVMVTGRQAKDFMLKTLPNLMKEVAVTSLPYINIPMPQDVYIRNTGIVNTNNNQNSEVVKSVNPVINLNVASVTKETLPELERFVQKRLPKEVHKILDNTLINRGIRSR